MKSLPRPNDEACGIRLPRELMAEIRRQAREDDRTVSAYLRRLIANGVQQVNEKSNA